MSAQHSDTCAGDCSGFLQCSACGELVGWCLAGEASVDLCKACGTCAHCGKPAEGDYSIHRDAYGVGPVLQLCEMCGGYVAPTLEQIWYRIAKAGPFAEAREAGIPLEQLLRDVPRTELHDA